MRSNHPAILAEHISKSFGDHVVLDDVDFETGAGRIFGILGPSGAGKTTLIKILTGQLRPEGGAAWIFGETPEALMREGKNGIGIMMDDQGLYERLSCSENLEFYADIFRVPRTHARDVLSRVGLLEARKTRAARLSKGMRNRLSLARALLREGKVLFLDEPTSGLDPLTKSQIHDILLDEKNHGRAVFLATHDMAEAHKLCDDLILLSGGKIIESGPPKEIVQRADDLNRLIVTLEDGREITLRKNADGGARLHELLGAGTVRTVHTSEPTLESVFIEKTGKGLDHA